MQARRALQRLAGDIDSDHAGSRAVELRAERALAAADVEHTLSRRDVAQQEGPANGEPLGLRALGHPLPDGLVVSARAHERTRLERTDQPAAPRCRRGPWEKTAGCVQAACHPYPKVYHPNMLALAMAPGLQIDRADPGVRVAFDTRPSAQSDGVGRYARCLLRSLRDTRPPADELLETERPPTALRSSAADVLHSPCFDGAMLHSPCPMVVTIHDLSALKRASEHLRGGVRTRLRQLAVQRAAGVIAPTETVARTRARTSGSSASA